MRSITVLLRGFGEMQLPHLINNREQLTESNHRKEQLLTTQQGTLDLLNDPVAQQLFRSKRPAQLAYNWRDGTPRVVPIGFHWNGEEIVLGTPSDSPKMKVLQDGAKVALTIDTDTMPYQALLLRGTVRVDTVEGIAPEYVAMTLRVLGEEVGNAWLQQLRPICPWMSRIFVRPEWVDLLDFTTRFPNALERAMASD